MKKFLIVCLAMVMLFAMAVPAFAYTDTGNLTAAEKAAIDRLSELEIIEGYADGTFRPDDLITRAEFAKVADLTDVEISGEATTQMFFSFSDLKDDAWYNNWIQVACNRGLMEGYPDSTFRPNDNITGNEAVTVMVRMLGHTDESLGGIWPANYVAKARELGLLADVNADLSRPIDRAAVCVLAANTLTANAAPAETPVDTDSYGVIARLSSDGRQVTITDLKNTTRTYVLASDAKTDSGALEQNRLVRYEVKSGQLVTVEASSVETDLSAVVADSRVTLNNQAYTVTGSTEIYRISGRNGNISLTKLDNSSVMSSSYVAGIKSTALSADLQYVASGSNLELLLIGSYTTGGSLFGFVEELGVSTADYTNGVVLFGDKTVYEVSDRSDAPAYNTLFVYTVSGDVITMNRVDRAAEQVKDGKITDIEDGLVNTDNGQFIVTAETVIIKATYDQNGDLSEVEYDARLRVGNEVSARYVAGHESDSEAAYVLIEVTE